MKSKRKEKVPSQAKSKRKTVESPAEGAPNKKLLVSIMHVAKRLVVQSSYLFIFEGGVICRALYIKFLLFMFLSCRLGRAEEATPFPLDLDGKTIISMMVEEPQLINNCPQPLLLRRFRASSRLRGQWLWRRGRRSRRMCPNLSLRKLLGVETMNRVRTRRSSMRRTFLKYS